MKLWHELLLIGKRAMQSYRIDCLQAEYEADREELSFLAQKLAADRRAIARAQENMKHLYGYSPSAEQLGVGKPRLSK